MSTPGQSDRERRLAEALRANLRRRKAQARSRRAGEADGRAGLEASAAADARPDAAAEATGFGEERGFGAAAPSRREAGAPPDGAPGPGMEDEAGSRR